MKDATAALIVLQAKTLHSENLNMTADDLHALIVEALELNEMELPYATKDISAHGDTARPCARE